MLKQPYVAVTLRNHKTFVVAILPFGLVKIGAPAEIHIASRPRN